MIYKDVLNLYCSGFFFLVVTFKFLRMVVYLWVNVYKMTSIHFLFHKYSRCIPREAVNYNYIHSLRKVYWPYVTVEYYLRIKFLLVLNNWYLYFIHSQDNRLFMYLRPNKFINFFSSHIIWGKSGHIDIIDFIWISLTSGLMKVNRCTLVIYFH